MLKLFLNRTEQANLLAANKLNIQYHFGCLGKEEMTANRSPFNYSLCKTSHPSIFTPLILRKESGDPKQSTIMCDKRSPTVALSLQAYVDMELFGSTFFPDAFWALPLQIEWTNNLPWYLAIQRALWINNGYVAVYHGKEQLHIADDVLNTETATTAANYDPKMVQYLQRATCSQAKTTYQCFVSILDALSQQWPAIISPQAKTLLTSWGSVLERYIKFPGKKFADKRQCSEKHVHFQPSLIQHQKPLGNNNSVIITTAAVRRSLGLVRTICPQYLLAHDLGKLLELMREDWKQYDDMLLIVVFNSEHYEAVRYVEAIYNSFFKYILFCGPDYRHDNVPFFSFASFGSTPAGNEPGSFNYECISLAYSMYPNMADGYFVIGDDILLLFDRFISFSTHKTWYIPLGELIVSDIERQTECLASKCGHRMEFHWFKRYREAMITALYDLRQQAITSQLFHR